RDPLVTGVQTCALPILIAGVRGKPGLHRRVGVGAIVVEDQMDRQSARCGALDPLQKAQKLLMAMAWHAVAQHLTAQYVQGREQSRGSMAGVIVRLPLGDSRTEGQNRSEEHTSELQSRVDLVC